MRKTVFKLERACARRAAMLLVLARTAIVHPFREERPGPGGRLDRAGGHASRRASLGRDDTGLVATSTCGCRKSSLVSSPVSRLFFTGTRATPTCRARNGGDFGQTNPTCLSLASPLRKRHFRRTTAEARTKQAEPTGGQLKARHISAKTGLTAPLLERTRHATGAS